MGSRRTHLLALLIGVAIGVGASFLLMKSLKSGPNFQSVAEFYSLGLTLIIAYLAYRAILTQVGLHREVYRPAVVCDFIVHHGVTYFRVKNFGTLTAFHVQLAHVKTEPDDNYDWKALSVVKHGIRQFPPNAEALFFYQV